MDYTFSSVTFGLFGFEPMLLEVYVRERSPSEPYGKYECGGLFLLGMTSFLS